MKEQSLVLQVLVVLLFLAATTAVPAIGFEVRTIDGSDNNLQHPEYGRAGSPLLRLASVGYDDKVQVPAGSSRNSARLISNLLAAQGEAILPNEAGVSDFIWLWGQFLDHDIDLTPEASPLEPFYVPVPSGDPYFDPYYEGGKYILLHRSRYMGGTGKRFPRQQLNTVTAFIDASNVYGSDPQRAAALRTFEGGKLKTTSGGLFLPFNTEGLDNAGGPEQRLFLAGDVRANEQIALTALHTLFVREHNRLCDEIMAEFSGLGDEEIYQRVRKIVGAQMQVITYREFLPLLLGHDAVPPYRGYKAKVNPGIANEFSTAAYRFGHSMLSPVFLRVNCTNQQIVTTDLKDAFFNPLLIYQGGGIEPILHGMATQVAQRVDNKLVDGVRNFLFGAPGEGGFDLAALNIQRGRDHGLADYNRVRKACRLPEVRKFSDVTGDEALQEQLRAAYGSPEDMDLWVAGLAEPHVAGALVGETFHRILVKQFVRLRDGDRFWYQNDPFFTTNPDLMAAVKRTRLADVIRRNAVVDPGLQDNVFIAE